MAYGLSFTPIDSPVPIDISNNWLPGRYVGSFTASSMNYGDSYGRILASVNYNVPNGTILWAVPKSTPSSNVRADSDQFGSFTSSYAQSVIVSGKTVQISFDFWSGFASSFWVGLRIEYDVYGYYPASASNGYGVLFSGSGIQTAIDNDTSIQMCVWRHQETTASRSLSLNTGIPSSSAPPTIFAHDSAESTLSGYLYTSGSTWWYRLYRNDHIINKSNGNPTVSSGLVKIAGFVPFDGISGSYGMNIYSKSGSLIFSTRHSPLMPRGVLPNPIPIPDGSNTSRVDAGGYTFDALELSEEPMIIPRYLGVGKSDQYATSVGVAVSNGRYTWGWSNGVPRGIVGESSHGFWGVDNQSADIPYIFSSDYF